MLTVDNCNRPSTPPPNAPLAEAAWSQSGLRLMRASPAQPNTCGVYHTADGKKATRTAYSCTTSSCHAPGFCTRCATGNGLVLLTCIAYWRATPWFLHVCATGRCRAPNERLKSCPPPQGSHSFVLRGRASARCKHHQHICQTPGTCTCVLRGICSKTFCQINKPVSAQEHVFPICMPGQNTHGTGFPIWKANPLEGATTSGNDTEWLCNTWKANELLFLHLTAGQLGHPAGCGQAKRAHTANSVLQLAAPRRARGSNSTREFVGAPCLCRSLSWSAGTAAQPGTRE